MELQRPDLRPTWHKKQSKLHGVVAVLLLCLLTGPFPRAPGLWLERGLDGAPGSRVRVLADLPPVW